MVNNNDDAIVLHPKERHEMAKPFVRIFFEIVIFAFIGLILGIGITFFFPSVSSEESVWITLFWLFVQFFVTAIFIFMVDRCYFYVFGIDSDEYIGITIFANVIFASQIQLYGRINLLYEAITGSSPSSKLPPTT